MHRSRRHAVATGLALAGLVGTGLLAPVGSVARGHRGGRDSLRLSYSKPKRDTDPSDPNGVKITERHSGFATRPGWVMEYSASRHRPQRCPASFNAARRSRGLPAAAFSVKRGAFHGSSDFVTGANQGKLLQCWYLTYGRFAANPILTRRLNTAAVARAVLNTNLR